MAPRLLVSYLAVALLLSSCLADTGSPTPAPASSANATAEVIAAFYNAFDAYTPGTINTTLNYLVSTGVLNEYFNLPNATLLYPVDSAYKLLPSAVVKLLNTTDGPYILANVLRYHIIPEYYDAQGLQGLSFKYEVPNLLGAPLYLVNVGDSISFATNASDIAKNVTVDGPDAFNDFLSHSAHTIPEVLLPANLSVLLPPPASAPAPAPAPAPSSSSSTTPSTSPSKSASGRLSTGITSVLIVVSLFLSALAI